MNGTRNNCAVLKNGQLMPLLGLGCSRALAGEVEEAVEVALDNGYRHIDTAYNYLNEAEVGHGIHNWINKDPKNNKREDLFIVTKLPSIGMSPDGVRKFLSLSLKALGLSYIDLYLIHAPFGYKGQSSDKDIYPLRDDGLINVDNGTDLISIWKELEKMVDEGKVKSIGVSNFSVKQLRKINAISRISCVTNQIELHIEFQQREMVKYCKENNIVITAYSPLGSPGRSKSNELKFSSSAGNFLDNPVVILVAERHKVTTAQVLIRFLVQQGFVTIPKSITPQRIKTNGQIINFTLSDTEMNDIKVLDKGEDARIFQFHKLLKGLELHPEYHF